MTLIEILGLGAAIALFVALWARPSGAFAIVFALAIVSAAIAVSWNDVEQAREQRVARAAFEQRMAATQPSVTVPPPVPRRSGT